MEDFKVTGIHCGCGNCHNDDDCKTEKHSHNGDCCEHHNCCNGEGNSHCCDDEHIHNYCDDEEEPHSKLKGILLGVSAVITALSVILHLTVDFSPVVIGIACGVATVLAGN